MVRITTGTPRMMATQVSAGVARTAQTATASTKMPKTPSTARPAGVSPAKGYARMAMGWAPSSTADGCCLMVGSTPTWRPP